MVVNINAIVCLSRIDDTIIIVLFRDRRVFVVELLEACEVISFRMVFLTGKLCKIGAQIDIIRAVTVKLGCILTGKELLEQWKRLIGEPKHNEWETESFGITSQLGNDLAVIALAGRKNKAGSRASVAERAANIEVLIEGYL